MKLKLLIMSLFLIAGSSAALAERPSLAAMDAKLNALINNLVACPSNSPTRFVDNGDGTICDAQTGLMWEKKQETDPSGIFYPGNVDNTYQWSENDGLNAKNGSLFTFFLTWLNGETANYVGPTGSGEYVSYQLDGYSDWRLPTLSELKTLIPPCSSRPCDFIYPIFGPTAAGEYWTSTAVLNFEDTSVIGVSFADGKAHPHSKTDALNARAVRGGRK